MQQRVLRQQCCEQVLLPVQQRGLLLQAWVTAAAEDVLPAPFPLLHLPRRRCSS